MVMGVLPWVGDRGMITSARIAQELKPAGLDWISCLRAPQIAALAEDRYSVAARSFSSLPPTARPAARSMAARACLAHGRRTGAELEPGACGVQRSRPACTGTHVPSHVSRANDGRGAPAYPRPS